MPVYKSDEKTKDGRSWYFKTYKKDFQGNSKAYKSKKYATKSEAQEAERLFLMKRDNPNKKKFVLVAKDFFEDYKQSNKESSYEALFSVYNNHVKPYFEKDYINDINVLKIKQWKEMILSKNYKKNYLNKIYNALYGVFQFAIREYGLSTNPLAIVGGFKTKDDKIKKDEEKLRYITLEDFNVFISVIDDSFWRTFFIFLYYTGMRKGEVIALKWNDIDLDNKIINVHKTLNYKHKEGKITSTKTGKNRNIKMSNTLYECLLKYKEEIMNYTDFDENWFVFGNSRFLAPTTIDRFKDEYFKKANLWDKRITLHEFRHSHISLLINEYIKSSKERNLKVDTAKFFLMMSERMGHTVKTMQDTYMHLFPTVQDEIVDLLDNL